MTTDRYTALQNWLSRECDKPYSEITTASEDASFRRYFRTYIGDTSYIIMDAPPPQENCRPFVTIATLLEKHNLHVPHIYSADIERGFLLLSDLGDTAYLKQLNQETADWLYGDALNALFKIQTEVPSDKLPPYDDALLSQEMELFREWFLQRHLKLILDEHSHEVLTTTFRQLTKSALEQPTVFVHRDYHSRNLMISDDNPGILDFQDAVRGPVTYDLVSLLRDCYISWPEDKVTSWVNKHHDRLVSHGYIDADYSQFKVWFDLMGMQRHLKAIGIFSRLKHRDGKGGYIKDIPRTMEYVMSVCGNYPELREFKELMKQLDIPAKLAINSL